ncbi:DUF2917 domain-containing protein [Niveibacterium sp.]|uniref:DUF2917 domain-containing protein n=1 Tax=Niveibacterium sp. TaxID=2017444 RepID=UPI0035ADC0C8
MKVNLTQGAIDLAQGKLLSLDSATGWTLQVKRGVVWATSPDMPGDHFIRSGQSLRLTGASRVIVEALQDCEIGLAPAQRAAKSSARHSAAPATAFNACAA